MGHEMEMMNSSNIRKVRKGTRSCMECRRRKLRCSWTSDETQTCRRCEERHFVCVPQTFSSPSSSQPARPLRNRVSELEHQVDTLTQALLSLERAQSKDQPVNNISHLLSCYDGNRESNPSEFGSPASNVAMRTPPLYLDALFNNSLLMSTKNDAEGEVQPHSSQLSDSARSVLQPLIPQKADLELIASRASSWLSLLNEIFPVTTVVRSGQEMMSRYEELTQPKTDPLLLASWLLTVALTAEHNPGVRLRLRSTRQPQNGVSDYSGLVVSAVEKAVIPCDQLMSSASGIETAILLVRLNLTRGNFTKAFFNLRRAIAVAELIGLPWVEKGHRAVLWRCICIADRFQSMVLATPSATQHYCIQESEVTSFDHTTTRKFLLCLSDIALRIGGPKGPHSNAIPLEMLQKMVSELESNLEGVRSLMSPDLWLDFSACTLAEQMMQYFYHYVEMRVHLPLVIRQDRSTQSIHSRIACTRACHAVLERYLIVYDLLPQGFFIHRIMDLQVFTAAVVLLLAEHSADQAESEQSDESTLSPASVDVINRLLQAVEQNLDCSLSGLGRETLMGIHALTQLLSKGELDPREEHASFFVPLLGKLHVQRKRAPEYERCAPDRLKSPEMLEMQSGRQFSDTLGPELEMFPVSWSIEEISEHFFYDVMPF